MTVTIRESILAYMKELFDKDMVITDDTLLEDNLGMDSLDVFELNLAIENDTGIYLDDTEIDRVWSMKTIGELITFVESKAIRND